MTELNADALRRAATVLRRHVQSDPDAVAFVLDGAKATLLADALDSVANLHAGLADHLARDTPLGLREADLAWVVAPHERALAELAVRVNREDP